MRWFTRRKSRSRGSDDTGSTMMEVVVGMAVMGIFLSIFTGAVYSMSRVSNKVTAATISAGQANVAFLKLDKLVRYSSAISTTGQAASGDWYIELDNTATAPETCTQLRVNGASGQLQQRTWTITNGIVGAASAWQMLAYGVTNATAAAGSVNQPFTVPTGAAAASSPYQQLALTLVIKSGGATSSTTRSQVTFTAINSSAAATTNSGICQQKGRP